MTSQISKPTIYDVAAASGASASTVSAALNGNWRKRRVKEETVRHIKNIAATLGYSVNLQARGLRKARSGLVGMILPVHDNRFFSSLAQHFATEVRNRGLCPVIVSTRREPEEEVQSVEDLLSYAIDSLIIAGSTDPDALSSICNQADLAHVFVDLPSSTSPSVVADNTEGAEKLTHKIIDLMPRIEDPLRGRAYFLGGNANFYATSRRVAAFRRVTTERLGHIADNQVINCGYVPARAAEEMERLVDRIGGLPTGLFINSIPVFEGALSYLVNLPADAFAETAVGCYDYDPFGSFLQFPVHMVAQNSRELIQRCFALLDAGVRDPVLEMVAPELVPPRTIRANRLGERG
jgi:LacI family fructose operon transcriptional repressor